MALCNASIIGNHKLISRVKGDLANPPSHTFSAHADKPTRLIPDYGTFGVWGALLAGGETIVSNKTFRCQASIAVPCLSLLSGCQEPNLDQLLGSTSIKIFSSPTNVKIFSFQCFEISFAHYAIKGCPMGGRLHGMDLYMRCHWLPYVAS